VYASRILPSRLELAVTCGGAATSDSIRLEIRGLHFSGTSFGDLLLDTFNFLLLLLLLLVQVLWYLICESGSSLAP
jgi:hypothetical protein